MDLALMIIAGLVVVLILALIVLTIKSKKVGRGGGRPSSAFYDEDDEDEEEYEDDEDEEDEEDDEDEEEEEPAFQFVDEGMEINYDPPSPTEVEVELSYVEPTVPEPVPEPTVPEPVPEPPSPEPVPEPWTVVQPMPEVMDVQIPLVPIPRYNAPRSLVQIVNLNPRHTIEIVSKQAVVYPHIVFDMQTGEKLVEEGNGWKVTAGQKLAVTLGVKLIGENVAANFIPAQTDYLQFEKSIVNLGDFIVNKAIVTVQTEVLEDTYLLKDFGIGKIKLI